ncbi:CAP domain-containing protein [Corynebacterium callunae]|uniref:SCP/PR1 domain-containing protein n=1 Tax=Corynebacterium callunae DSM 20147 TaxID=1121353 RepID=M1UVM7_9CORY|nr:CAP domain-containing protein [Corynebacterium callunae]AGG67542.1 SCP/PR1 domain-containing protein [Corynebacterium callunae DSM 20147]
MQNLENQVRTWLQQFGVQPSQADIISSLSRAIPILSILLTAILSFNAISSGNTSQAPQLDQLRTDVIAKINYERNQQGLLSITPGVDLHNAAQKEAEENAATGTEGPVADPAEDLVVLQINMPYGQANADYIVDTLLASPAHRDLLLAPSYQAVGVGAAYKGDRVWVVVEFTINATNSVELTG